MKSAGTRPTRSGGSDAAGRALPRLYLHIGINKTGTSAIQKYLAEHDAELAASGLLYPRSGRENVAHYQLSRALGFAAGRQYATAAPPAATPRGWLARLRARLGPPAPPPRRLDATGLAQLRGQLRAQLLQECTAAPLRAVVLSSEHFVRPVELAPVREFLAGFDCRVVVYLRRHDHWWVSAYGQALKSVTDPPWSPGLEGYIAYSRQRNPGQRNYRALLERWSAVFGAGNIIVRPFESVQNPGGVVADFLRAIGQPELAGAAAAAVRVNESLGSDTLWMLEMLQRAQIPQATRQRLKGLLIEQGAAGTRAELMSPRLRRELIDENRADYAWIARHFLGREDGLLFREPEPRGDESWVPPPQPGTVEVLSRIVGLLENAR